MVNIDELSECSAERTERERIEREKPLWEKRKSFLERLREGEVQNVPDRNANNLFEAQQITVKSPIWGDIYITKEYFLFASFGIKTPSNKVNCNQYQTCVGRKKKLILRWRDIEEIACRKIYG